MMEWNPRQQILQKWPPFGLQQVQIQQHQPVHQQQHHIQGQHQQQHTQHQAAPQQVQQVTEQVSAAPTAFQNKPKVNRSGGSATPHCLVCNVHLGMFAKGGMEIFSEKVTTSYSKTRISSVVGLILNQVLNSTNVHSSIVCKKCFKLLDDIDNLEGRLIGLKQVVSSKYTMTLALVKKGLVGKAVIEETAKQPTSPSKFKKPVTVFLSDKMKTPKCIVKRQTKMGTPRKGGKLAMKSGKLVVKDAAEILLRQPDSEPLEDDDDNDDNLSSDDDGIIDSEPLEVEITDPLEVEEIDEDKASHKCVHCGKEFSSRIVLSTHIETHGITGDAFKCNLCSKSFFNEESLTKHKKLHSKGKRTKQSCSALDVSHMKQFLCRECGKVFATKSKAKDHERTHTGEKPFECDICGTSFRQKSNLSSHVRVTHLQEKKYKCQVCDKTFKWKRLLTGHTMSVHTGERPYKCEFCDAGFVYQQHYKKHMRIHTGEKPFKCDVCGKAFNSSNNCRAHMFTHSDKKPYECTLCGAGFMRKPLALAHIKQHEHGDNIEAYVKANNPTTTTSRMSVQENNVPVPVPVVERVVGNATSGASSAPRRIKINKPQIQTAVMHIPQEAHQTVSNAMEEGISHFIIQNNDNRETTNTGETLGYMFSAYPAQATTSQYSQLSIGQW